MISFKHILFDLDGTIIDPKKGVVEAVVFALSKFDIRVKDPEKLTCFIGPPLTESFRDYYDMNEETAKRALGYYREHYSHNGLYNHSLYYGMDKLIENLYDKGKKLYIATSKPEKFARQILDDLHLTKYFEYISGCDIEENICDKPTIISRVLERIDDSELDRCIMVGDTKYDVKGAKACDITSMAVLQGYGDITEIIMAGVDFFMADAEELAFVLK